LSARGQRRAWANVPPDVSGPLRPDPRTCPHPHRHPTVERRPSLPLPGIRSEGRGHHGQCSITHFMITAGRK
jgi:hypothetical protein